MCLHQLVSVKITNVRLCIATAVLASLVGCQPKFTQQAPPGMVYDGARMQLVPGAWTRPVKLKSSQTKLYHQLTWPTGEYDLRIQYGETREFSKSSTFKTHVATSTRTYSNPSRPGLNPRKLDLIITRWEFFIVEKKDVRAIESKPQWWTSFPSTEYRGFTEKAELVGGQK